MEEDEFGFESYDKDMLLKDMIISREKEYADIVTLTKSLSKSIELYAEKLDLNASSGFLILNSSNEKGVFEYDTMLIKMLDVLSEEIRLLGSRLDRFRKRIEGSNLLPYSREDIEQLLFPCLKKVDYFECKWLVKELNRKDLEKAYINTKKVWIQMRRQLFEFSFAAYGDFTGHRESLFFSISNRYKEDNKAMLDNYKRDIDDIKEAKKELKDKLGSDKAVTIWENEGRDIVRTISEMAEQRYVERDLLPLLEYKSKYDLLTELEKGEVEQKDENGKKDDKRKKILFESEAVKKKERNRLKEFLKNNPSYNKGWSSSKENPTTDVVLCFVKHWVEQGSIEADYPVSTLVEWVVKECGVKLEGVDMKTLSNKMRDWKRNGKKIDSEIEKRVGAEFKNK